MNDADDPIPVDAISSRDAFDIVYQAITPDWQILAERLNPSSLYYDAFHERHDKDRAYREADRTYHEAQWRANEWLLERIRQGTLTAWISDPDSKQVFQLDRHTGIAGNLFEPREFRSRPNKIIKVPRTVFFDRKSFDKVLTEIATPPNKGGRPPEYDWGAIKAFTLKQIAALGVPGKNNKRLPSKAQLIEIIQKEWSQQFDQDLPNSSVRSHLNRWLAQIDQD